MNDRASEIAEGVETGIKRSRIRMSDKRLILIFVFVVLVSLGLSLWTNHTTSSVKRGQHKLAVAEQQIEQNQVQIQSQQAQIVKQQAQIVTAQKAAVTVCQATDTANANTRSILSQLASNAQNSTGITAAQKTAALAAYANLENGFPNIDCSHLAGQ